MNHKLCASLLACAATACVPTAPLTDDPIVPAGPPGPVDCAAAEQGLEFGPFTIADFDQVLNHTTYYYDDAAKACAPMPRTESYPSAQYFYSYFDGTSYIGNPGYQPRTQQETRCVGRPNNFVMHMNGGPYLGWGGGMGVAMQHFAQDQGLCPIGDIFNPNRPSYCAPASAANGNNVAYAAMNLSEWDGVAVWARRGATSQPLLRVLVGTKDTDDDIAFLMYEPTNPNKPLYCQRVRDCSCQFNDVGAGGTEHECTYYDKLPDDSRLCFSPQTPFQKGFYCGRPGSTPAAFESGNNSCDQTQCDSPYSAFPDRGPDPQFANKKCTPTTSRAGAQTSLCRNPEDPFPEPDQLCGDHFTFPLHLTTDWKLYLVPFSQMYQQGFGKMAQTFDLTSISLVRLTWDAGPTDYYVDDLRFYRAKRN